ncbi:MAG: hypothetical protein WKF73_10150, partial [Nocardioidaceae bacterium]
MRSRAARAFMAEVRAGIGQPCNGSWILDVRVVRREQTVAIVALDGSKQIAHDACCAFGHRELPNGHTTRKSAIPLSAASVSPLPRAALSVTHPLGWSVPSSSPDHVLFNAA